MWLTWWRDGEYLGVVQAGLSGQTLQAHRQHGDVERLKQALASWAVDELQREVEARGGRSTWAEETVLAVDKLAVERRAASSEPLPELVEERAVGSFDA